MAGKIDPIMDSLITDACNAARLDYYLVAAMVLTESNGETHAIRYERGYRYVFEPYKVKPEGCSRATEINAQQCSWGLMQIMGATARELGFRGWMPELCRPEIGLAYGCKYLARQIKRYANNVQWGVAAYNAGSFPAGQRWVAVQLRLIRGPGDEADGGAESGRARGPASTE